MPLDPSAKPNLTAVQALGQIHDLIERAHAGGAVSNGKLYEILSRVPGHYEERRANDASERYHQWVYEDEAAQEAAALKFQAQQLNAQLREALLASAGGYDAALLS
jgi:hypothetical protein